MTLEFEGYRVIGAGSGKAGLDAAAASPPDLILLDIKMPHMDGLEVLALLRDRYPAVPVVMISGHGSIATAVDAIRAGAFDYMEKPLESDVVLLRVARALESRQLRDEVEGLRLKYEERFRMVGDSAALQAVREAIAKAAPVKASVLITGESGVGKELVARAIHRNSSRASKPFVRVNCAAIPEDLIESELFGHERGSFTGATRDQVGKFVQADDGTIFLDEVGDMSLKTQAKVLRVLQDGEVEPVGAAKAFTVDVRVIAATNKELTQEIRVGRFREDLYYRLNVVPIEVPPLRRRREEIPALVQHFATEFCRENNSRKPSFTRPALSALAERGWRGNVRELKNAVERLIIMSDRDAITPEEIERILPGSGAPVSASAAIGSASREEFARDTAPPMTGENGAIRETRGAPTGIPSDAGTNGSSEADPVEAATLQQFKDSTERTFIVKKLKDHDWNITATARGIDTPRSNLYKKLEQYGITKEKDGS